MFCWNHALFCVLLTNAIVFAEPCFCFTGIMPSFRRNQTIVLLQPREATSTTVCAAGEACGEDGGKRGEEKVVNVMGGRAKLPFSQGGLCRDGEQGCVC